MAIRIDQQRQVALRPSGRVSVDSGGQQLGSAVAQLGDAVTKIFEAEAFNDVQRRGRIAGSEFDAQGNPVQPNLPDGLGPFSEAYRRNAISAYTANHVVTLRERGTQFLEKNPTDPEAVGSMLDEHTESTLAEIDDPELRAIIQSEHKAIRTRAVGQANSNLYTQQRENQLETFTRTLDSNARSYVDAIMLGDATRAADLMVGQNAILDEMVAGGFILEEKAMTMRQQMARNGLMLANVYEVQSTIDSYGSVAAMRQLERLYRDPDLGLEGEDREAFYTQGMQLIKRHEAMQGALREAQNRYLLDSGRGPMIEFLATRGGPFGQMTPTQLVEAVRTGQLHPSYANTIANSMFAANEASRKDAIAYQQNAIIAGIDAGTIDIGNMDALRMNPRMANVWSPEFERKIYEKQQQQLSYLVDTDLETVVHTIKMMELNPTRHPDDVAAMYRPIWDALDDKQGGKNSERAFFAAIESYAKSYYSGSATRNHAAEGFALMSNGDYADIDETQTRAMIKKGYFTPPNIQADPIGSAQDMILKDNYFVGTAKNQLSNLLNKDPEQIMAAYDFWTTLGENTVGQAAVASQMSSEDAKLLSRLSGHANMFRNREDKLEAMMEFVKLERAGSTGTPSRVQTEASRMTPEQVDAYFANLVDTMSTTPSEAFGVAWSDSINQGIDAAFGTDGVENVWKHINRFTDGEDAQLDPYMKDFLWKSVQAKAANLPYTANVLQVAGQQAMLELSLANIVPVQRDSGTVWEQMPPELAMEKGRALVPYEDANGNITQRWEDRPLPPGFEPTPEIVDLEIQTQVIRALGSDQIRLDTTGDRQFYNIEDLNFDPQYVGNDPETGEEMYRLHAWVYSPSGERILGGFVQDEQGRELQIDFNVYDPTSLVGRAYLVANGLVDPIPAGDQARAQFVSDLRAGGIEAMGAFVSPIWAYSAAKSTEVNPITSMKWEEVVRQQAAMEAALASNGTLDKWFDDVFRVSIPLPQEFQNLGFGARIGADEPNQIPATPLIPENEPAIKRGRGQVE